MVKSAALPIELAALGRRNYSTQQIRVATAAGLFPGLRHLLYLFRSPGDKFAFWQANFNLAPRRRF
jgi:hypothetical protein